MEQTDNRRTGADRQPSSERQELEELLVRIGEGEQHAFQLFYQRTHRRVYALVCRVLRDRAMSEDVTQEVFLVVWERAATYRRDAGSPMTWLMTISHHRAVERVRSEQAHARSAARYAASAHSVEYDEVSETVLDRATAATLTRCLATLTDLQREAIGMAFYGGMTYRQVADELDAAPGTVKSRIRDGIITLQLCLEAG